MTRKTPATEQGTPLPAPAPGAHPLPATGGAFVIVDGALVADQNADPVTRMPGDVASETTV